MGIYLFIGVFIILFSLFYATEVYVGSALTLFVFAVLSVYIGWGTDLLNSVLNPWNDLYFVVGYFSIGLIWSFIKTLHLAFKTRNRILAKKVVYDDDNERKYKTFYDYYKAHWSYDNDFPKFSVLNHKAQITGWIGFWWADMFTTILGDWAYELVKFLYNTFFKFYQAIGNSVYNFDEKA